VAFDSIAKERPDESFLTSAPSGGRNFFHFPPKKLSDLLYNVSSALLRMFACDIWLQHKFNTLQHTATHCNTSGLLRMFTNVTSGCNTSATHCNTLQHTATHCNTSGLLRMFTKCDIWLQHKYNTLQHTATHCNTSGLVRMFTNVTSGCNTSATHCNTLQHERTCENVYQ